MAKGQVPVTGISTPAAASIAAFLPGSASASVPALDGVLLGHIIEVVAASLAFWFKPVCVCVALVWLSIRAHQVLNKPLDELATLLGFDIPLTPTVDLAGIKADGAVVHWSLSETQKHKSTLRYEVHVNGIVVDSVSFQESAVRITGLTPGTPFVVRVALVNNLDFSSKSTPIRFCTRDASSGDFYRPDQEFVEPAQMTIKITPFRGLQHISPPSPDAVAPQMTRESSTGIGHKASVNGGRPSLASLGIEVKHDPQSEDSEPPEGSESIQELSERLEAIRNDIEETERLAKEEEDDELHAKAELIKERDELRADVAEKDRCSRNLRRELNSLERQNTAAQNERSKHERLLQQKEQERQKGREDAVRWQQETVQFKADVERLAEEKDECARQAAAELEALRPKLAEKLEACKALDDEIRELNAEIKRIERATKEESPGHEDQDNAAQPNVQEMEEDRMWGDQRSQLHTEYTNMCAAVDNARVNTAAWASYLDHCRAARRQDEASNTFLTREYPTPPANERGPRRTDSQRSGTNGTGAHSASNESPRMGAFPPPFAATSFGPNIATPSYSAGTYMNLQNGMSYPQTDGLSITDEERERLTGGAPMSPGAGAELLPRGLLNGDDDRIPAADSTAILHGLGLPVSQNAVLPGLGQVPTQSDQPGPGPASPTSISSRTPSAFASPRASANNINLHSPDHLIDADRRSIHSTRSNRAFSGVGAASRFSTVFGISRSKNASMDDAASGLPSLGKVQSQSMPRHDQGLSGIDSAARKRNSSISDAVFGGTLGSALSDVHNVDLMDGSTAEPITAPRRRQFNLNPFSKDKVLDGWPSSFAFGRRPASPRPGSTHSTELPRPSFDSNRWGGDNWSMNDVPRSSPLSFVAWNNTTAGAQSRLFGSRHPSRRPSVQHAASGPPEDIMEDEDSDALDPDDEAHLAPIGTRPSPSKGKADASSTSSAPKLNPNAKDFRSFLSSMKIGGKDKAKPAESSEASSSRVGLDTTDDDAHSPPHSRKSRDTRSMTTTESSFADGQSTRESIDLARTHSYSDAPISGSPNLATASSSSIGKESFMAKLSRKSSSGKFSLSTFKRSQSRLGDPGMLTPTSTNSPRLGYGVEEDSEEPLSASTSSFREGGGRQSISGRWSTVLKLGKKGKVVDEEESEGESSAAG